MRPAVFTWPAVDADAICVAQTLGAAGALTINGAARDLALTSIYVNNAVFPGIERIVTGHSTGDINAVVFTITGKNLRGETVTDTITGINNTTVAGTVPMTRVTSIVADAAVGTAVEFGTGEVGSTSWYMTDNFAETGNITVALSGVSGTVAVTVQNTVADVQAAAPAAGDIFDHPTIAGATAKAESNYAFPPRFVRAINASGSGAFTFTVIQAG